MESNSLGFAYINMWKMHWCGFTASICRGKVIFIDVIDFINYIFAVWKMLPVELNSTHPISVNFKEFWFTFSECEKIWELKLEMISINTYLFMIALTCILS